VTAVLDTVLDLDRLVVAATLEAQQKLPSGSRFGGLHGGYATIGSSALRLVDFSFVPGLGLTGTLPIREGRLQVRALHVGGRAASHGTVLIGANRRVSGVLGGRRFNVGISTAVLSRLGASQGAAPQAGAAALTDVVGQWLPQSPASSAGGAARMQRLPKLARIR
jgi:hypothetical protein